MTSISNEHLEHVNLDYGISLRANAGEFGDSGSLVSESRNNTLNKDSSKDFNYQLTLQHVNGEAVFWDGGYSLKSFVTFNGSRSTTLSMSIETVLGKYLAGDYFRMDQSSDEIVLIKGNFQPISLNDRFGSLFQDGQVSATIFIRSRDFANDIAKKSRKAISDVNTNLRLFDDSNVIIITLEEASGRRILWDDTNKIFDSIIKLQVDRTTLETTRVDSVLSRVLAKDYFMDNSNDSTDKQIWTDKIKVVGLKDTLDVLCLSSNKIKLFLKHIRNSEEQQWQEILDAISQFKEKVGNTDYDLRSYYEDNHVFDDMEELKRQIQSDERNEQVIQDMMLKLEPKLNCALNFISTIEETEMNNGNCPESPLKTSSINLKETESHNSQSSRYEQSRVAFQFYHW